MTAEWSLSRDETEQPDPLEQRDAYKQLSKALANGEKIDQGVLNALYAYQMSRYSSDTRQRELQDSVHILTATFGDYTNRALEIWEANRGPWQEAREKVQRPFLERLAAAIRLPRG